MRVREKRRYEASFREQAVALLERTDRGLADVAESLGVPDSTLLYWYKQEMARRRSKPKAARAGQSAPASAAPTETVAQKLARLERENAALRKELEDLKLDKDILKKAAAFFAKEST
jgi:transposase